MVVLVVDDEHLDTEFIRRVVERAGFGVLVAEDYSTGLMVFRDNVEAVDLAIIDVSIPKRNGVELAIDLLRLKPGLKVLFTSGHVGAEIIRFYGLPASDRHFLQKPFRSEDLLSRVNEILQSDEPLDWLKRRDESSGRTASHT